MASLILKAIRANDVDRRKCERVVPMKVLVFGKSRTGTLSIRHALKMLGYNDVYHMESIVKDNPRDEDMWVEAMEAKYENKGKPYTREDWDKLLGHCMALSDSPCLAFMPELAAAYPDAKIILSLRDSPEQWYKSVQTTLAPLSEMLAGKEPTTVWVRLYNWFLPPMPLHRISEKLALHTNVKRWEDTPIEIGIKEYIDHNDEVRAMAAGRPGRLLEMNVKEGWAPLCEFLGEDIPTGMKGEKVPFPRVNDAASFNANVKMYRYIRHFLAAVNVLITLGILSAVEIGAYFLWKNGKSFYPFWIQTTDL
ncbi:hypothetical protein LSUE1_G002217 [Lachnellula suecica]|uniref:P-loop containing nucleoside triphosphate hydrolase protein n=1 Tax=Lachnellula suecica TaxID=602035 RepID=A0A8T9CA46_9HELO|nr:hypothetical protein LSUE1_G002217 [Lachnellula suecica]